MAKSKTTYVCTSCETIYPAWQGKCTSCGEWNTIVRDNFDESKLHTIKLSDVEANSKTLEEIKESGQKFEERRHTSLNSFNTIVGGGLVPGQVILFAGEPGIGKSTLLTQLCVNSELKILYISGEESLDQIAKRASRISKPENFTNAKFSNDTELEAILAEIKSKKYDLAIIDSIQTVYSKDISGFAGSMNQIRETANYITDSAKKNSVAVVMIGQITKEGNIAGPKLLEHMVDTVLYFEGDRKNDTRILRITKNRFGSTNEIAIFEMASHGLEEITNAEKYFIEDLKTEEGVAYTIFQEGSMSFILEIQALCTKSTFAYPKRISSGYDSKRLELIIAILVKKMGLKLFEFDIYVNVVGGIKIDDTSADLAVAMAIISSLKSKTIPEASCYIGELGLTGEIRSVPKLEQRLEKAKKYGFENIKSVKNMKRLEAKGKE